MTLTPGTHLGPYEILSPLGAGGMGEVYRARDTRLKRDVAIKVLPERLAKDPEALKRFEREAQAVAALSHPNILAIHDVGTESETSYVVTELLQGETLRERVRRSAIPWRKAVEIGTAIADGLAAAHAKGIVHRDLKPENIFLTKDGVVKILDFGLAHIETADSGAPSEDQANTPTMTLDTRPGTILGTISYMSPEQISGRATDARTDVFSFGCVLYEMISQQRAFGGKSMAEITTAILRDEPPTLLDSGQPVPVELDRVITRCHEKKPEQRFQSSGDLAFTLRTMLSDSGLSQPAASYTGLRMRTMVAVQLAVGVVALVALLLALNVGGWREWLFSEPQAVRIRSLAVLPLENLSGDPDQEYFADGMTDALTTNLSKIAALKVISRTSAMRYKGTGKSLPAIARELSVDAVVEGSVLRIGNRVRITVQLIEAATDRHVWADSYERELHDILALQNEVARTIAEAIEVKLTPTEHELLALAPQVNPEAYDAYARGMELVRRGTRRSCQTALTFFDQALDFDPQFALAHAGRARAYYELGSTHMHPGDTLPMMKQAAEAALALDESLPEAHIALGYYLLQSEWAWERAGESFKRARELNPNLAKARLAYADYLVAMKRAEEGMAELDMVLELNPAARYTERLYGAVSFMAGRFKRTIRDGREALKVDPEFWPAHQWMGLAQGELKQFADAVYHLRTADDLSKSPTVRAMLGAVLALAGELQEARSIREDLRSLPDTLYVCPYEVATISIALNEYDEAFDDMHQACDDRADCIPWLQVDPRLDPIRDDSRFDALLRRVGFQPRTPVLILPEPSREKVMLAVLPFEDMSPDPQDWFSDGMTEEMIAQLGRLHPQELGVIARTSAMRYKSTNKGVDRIGRELGVDYILEGSVRRAADRVRITAKLIQVIDQTQLWTDSFEEDLADVFAVQRSVAEGIARSLAVELVSDRARALAQPPASNPAAHEAYLKGRYFWNKRTPQGLKKGLEHFQQAIEHDPGYALAYAGVADSYVAMGSWNILRPREAYPKAKAAATKALKIDDTLAEAHASLAAVAKDYDWDFSGAQRGFKRALQLNPGDASAHQWYAEYLATMGKYEEAMVEIQRALELDPLSLIIRAAGGRVWYCARRYDLSIDYCHKALELDPNFAAAHLVLSFSYAAKGMYKEAVAASQKAIHLSGGMMPLSLASLGYAHALAGNRDEALRVLRELADLSKKHHVTPDTLVLVYIGLGEKDQVFEWLEKAVDERSSYLPFLSVEPVFDPLRSDPRFEAVLRRIGLPTSPGPTSPAP